jgi:hypothetical protein
VKRSSLLLIVAIAGAATLAAIVLRDNAGDPVGGSSLPPTTTTVAAAAETNTTPVPAATTTTTIARQTTTALPAGPVCDTYGSVRVAGTLAVEELTETSGIAASRVSDGVLWAHNDSGDEARLYAITTDGTLLGSFSVGRGLAFDWEDVAIGPGPSDGRSYLYVGDIGDNFAIRDGIITVYLIPEPEPSGSAAVEATYELVTADGPHDFEALFLADGDLYVATKEPTTRVYRGDVQTGFLELVAELDLGATVTGADVSRDGSIIAFRGYEHLWLWRRDPGQTVAEALRSEPCEVSSPSEEQGEAVAFLADGSLVTISEGEHPEVNVIDRT